MKDFYPYEKLATYPHMKPADVLIWERFLTQFPDMYDKVQYDLEVGVLPDFIKNDTNADLASMEALYKRKIDVVGFRDSQIDIIELKPRAGTSALGQVKGYVQLYIRDIDPGAQPKAVIVTDEEMPDMGVLAFGQDVQIVVV